MGEVPHYSNEYGAELWYIMCNLLENIDVGTVGYITPYFILIWVGLIE